MKFPPLVRILDPRPSPDPAIKGSVWIPLSGLPKRLGELPRAADPLLIANVEGGTSALEFLSAGGRNCQLVAPEWGENEPGRLWSPSAWLSQCVETLPLGTCLDMGCGQGREMAYLSALGWHVTGLDHLPEAIDAAREMVNRYGDPSHAAFERGQGQKASGSFDLVICLFLHDPIALRHAQTLVKPGGHLVIEGHRSKLDGLAFDGVILDDSTEDSIRLYCCTRP